MATIIALLVAVVIYALSVVVLKIFTKEEFKMMPAGDKIIKFLEKIKNLLEKKKDFIESWRIELLVEYSYCLVQAIKVHKYSNLIGGNLNEQS